jgi:hypothetical protein
MKFCVFCFLILLAGCSGHSDSRRAIGKHTYSTDQHRLIALRDSLAVEYNSATSPIRRQLLLLQYQQRLDNFLSHHPIDSIYVTVDAVLVNGRRVTTKMHHQNIQFQYGLTFNGSMSPRLDSIYAFVKGLKKGSDVLVNLSYTGACQVNPPDSGNLPVFKIFAFPVPLQYTGK